MQPVEYPSCTHWFPKWARIQIRQAEIFLKWFVWFLSMAPDDSLGYCFDRRVQLIIVACWSGQSCHSITSSIGKWHTEVTDCHAPAKSWPSDVPVGDSTFTGPDKQILEAWSDTLSFMSPPLSGHHCCPHPLLNSSVVCILTPDLVIESHTLLCWSCMSRLPPQPPAFLYEHIFCLWRQASEECVMIEKMFPLWFGP